MSPRSVTSRIASLRDSIWESDYVTVKKQQERPEPSVPAHELPALVEALRAEMRKAAADLEFERAAELRDRIRALEDERIRLG